MSTNVIDTKTKKPIRPITSTTFSMSRLGYKLYAIITLLIFVFFLTSGFWMPTSIKAKITPIGTSEQLGETSLTLKEWDYNPDNKSMLINIGIINNSIQLDTNYTFALVNEKNEAINADILFENEECIFLFIPQIKNSKAVSIQVKTKANEDKKTSKKNRSQSIIVYC